MTKRDYQLVADALRVSFEVIQREGIYPLHTRQKEIIITTMTRALYSHNPRFNSAKFETAVYGIKSHTA